MKNDLIRLWTQIKVDTENPSAILLEHNLFKNVSRDQLFVREDIQTIEYGFKEKRSFIDNLLISPM